MLHVCMRYMSNVGSFLLYVCSRCHYHICSHLHVLNSPQRDRELQQLKNQLKESKLESATQNSADKAASAALEEASRKQAEEW